MVSQLRDTFESGPIMPQHEEHVATLAETDVVGSIEHSRNLSEMLETQIGHVHFCVLG
jgi:hypothetical protein